MSTYKEGIKINNARFFGKQIIGDTDPRGPLLIRWIIFRIPAFGIYLHKYLRSDNERALHDHPWPFISIILKGGYTEIHDQTTTGNETKICVVRGNVLLRPAEWRHRVVLKGVPSWNLIIVGRRCRHWGFFTKTGWCWWRKYNPNLGICEDEPIFTTGKD